MHEENGLWEAWMLGNRNKNSCYGGQETGRHAHGSPVASAATIADNETRLKEGCPPHP